MNFFKAFIRNKKLALIILGFIFLVLVVVVFYFWKKHSVHITSFQKVAVNSAVLSDELKNCQNNSNKQLCWENGVTAVLKNQGLSAAYDTILKLYSSYPDFAPVCHGLTHVVGDKAYSLLFVEHKDFILPPNVSYCSFGFYHGFMQKLIHESNDPQQAKAFCEYADKQLRSISSGTLGTCYHGVGHGAVNDYDGKWPNEDTLVKPALVFCEKASPTPELLNRCASGVFNAMAVAYNSDNLTINKINPLWYCASLLKDYAKLACDEEMNTSLMKLTDNNFKKAAMFISRISDDVFALPAMDSLSGVNGQNGIKKDDFTDVVTDCRSLQSRFLTYCIKGYVPGLIQVGPPNLEYEKPLQYCATKTMTDQERSVCYSELIWQTKNIYPAEKEKIICAKIDEKYTQDCYQ